MPGRAVLTVLALAAVTSLTSACAPTGDLIVINRSNESLAIAPGMLIDACSARGFTWPEVETAAKAIETAVLVGEPMAWLPEGATFVDGGVPGRPIGAATPMTLVISSVDPPRTMFGPVSGDQLPPCGGRPIIGIQQ